MEAFYLWWIVHLQVRFHPALLIGPALKNLVRMIGASQFLAVVSHTLAIAFSLDQWLTRLSLYFLLLGAFNHQLTGSLPSELGAAWSGIETFNVAVCLCNRRRPVVILK
jgi:hypothetical protein